MFRSKRDHWLTVITDPEAIAEARRQALDNADAWIRQLMQTPELFYPDDIDRGMKANAAELLSAWRGLVSSANEPFKRRLAAAKILCDQHDSAGLAFLIDTIRTGKKPERRKALATLDMAVYRDAPWIRSNARELPGELLKLFERKNDDLIPMTSSMCKCLEVSGAAEKAIALWGKPISLWARCALLADLIPCQDKTESMLDTIEAALSEKTLSDSDLTHGLQCASAFLDSPDPALVRRSLKLIEKRFPWRKKELVDSGHGADVSWYSIIEDIGTRGGRAAAPLLERFLRSKLNSKYKKIALNCLVDVLGAEAIPYINPTYSSSASRWAVGFVMEGARVRRWEGRARPPTPGCEEERVVVEVDRDNRQRYCRRCSLAKA